MKHLLTSILLGMQLGAAASAADLPNIIFIYADDAGYGDIGCYGATAIDTPALDRMAQRGLRFTSAYATSATCTPSRYSLLTGEYAFRNAGANILPGNAPLIIDPNKATMASVLRDRGYKTGLVGKWHLGLGLTTEPLDWNGEIKPGPNQLGFDYSFHMAATGDRVPTVYIENGYIVNLDPSDPITVSYEDPVGDDPTGISHPHLLMSQADEQHAKTIVDGISRIGYMTGGHSARWKDTEMPDTFLGKAIEFIKENKDQPFFLLYTKHENHVPRIPHPRFAGSSGLGVRGDVIVQMDWGIGRLMEELEGLGLTENTLVIFSSDNGPVLYDGYYDGAIEKNGDHKPAGNNRGGKYSVWEGGTKMPFIVSWPGTIQPGISDALLSQVDMVATLAGLTGGTVPEGHATDSRNLVDVLLGKTEVGRDYLIQQGVQIQAIRMGPWKYIPPGVVTNRGGIDEFIRDRINEPGMLFYLPEDPLEQNNLAWRYPAKVAELRAILQRELRGAGGAGSTADPLGGAVDR